MVCLLCVKGKWMQAKNNQMDTHGGNVYRISKELGVDISQLIDFSANINPLGVCEKGKMAIYDAFDNIIHYPDPNYYNLRASIAAYHNVPIEWIMPSNGAVEGLFNFIRAILPNKSFVAAPTFVEYKRAIDASCSQYIPLYRENDFSISLDKLKTRLESATSKDLFVFCNPNNPTGTLTAGDDVVNIIKLCENKGMYLLIDEAFMDFASIKGAKSVVGTFYEGQKIASMHSITKFFAVPGLRIGYIICPNKKIRDMMKRVSSVWGVNYFADRFVQVALNDDEYIRATTQWFINESQYAFDSLEAINGIIPYESWANYIFFKCDVPSDIRDKLLQKNLMIRDCKNFDGLTGGYYRIAIKSHWENTLLYNELRRVIEEV